MTAPGIRDMALKAFKAQAKAMLEMKDPIEPIENAIKQALHRDGDLLFNAGMIDREGQWIWITDKGRGALK